MTEKTSKSRRNPYGRKKAKKRKAKPAGRQKPRKPADEVKDVVIRYTIEHRTVVTSTRVLQLDASARNYYGYALTHPMHKSELVIQMARDQMVDSRADAVLDAGFLEALPVEYTRDELKKTLGLIK